MPEFGSTSSRAASKLGEKLVEILDIFDLSFFMSGVVAASALLVYIKPPEDLLFRHTGVTIFGLVLSSYVLGLVCFAIGRWIRGSSFVNRMLQTVPSHVLFHAALEQQALVGEHDDALRRYFGHSTDVTDPGARMAAYTRMWVHVRSFPELSESFALLKRYWILAASYDGVAIALLLWLIPVWTGLVGGPGEPFWPVIWTLALPIASLFCWHRAIQYKHYQIEELVATTAHWLTLVGRPVLADLEAGPGTRAPDPSETVGPA